MEPGRQLRFIPLSSFLLLLLVNSTNALCVPRNSNDSLSTSFKSSPSQAAEATTQHMQPHAIKIPSFLYKSHSSAEAPSLAPQPSTSPSIASGEASSVSPQQISTTSSFAASVISGGDSPLDSLLGGAAKAICAKTDYPDVCESSLKPYKPSVGSVNAKTVAGMLLRACTEQTHAASNHAGQLMADSSTQKSIKSYIGVCKDSYSDALDNLDDAAAALASGDGSSFNIMVSAAMTDFESCEDGFDEISVVSPLRDIDGKLKQIASNILAVTSSMHF